jgi:hypothetical protein
MRLLDRVTFRSHFLDSFDLETGSLKSSMDSRDVHGKMSIAMEEVLIFIKKSAW